MSLTDVKNSLNEAASALDSLLKNEAMLQKVADAASVMVEALKAGGRIYSCGNGGSLCDAMHFAEEMTGRYRLNRRPLAATAISDVAHMACVANDFGYDEVFSRYIEGCARHGDVLLGISTSGTSKNIIKAAEVAKALGMKVIILTGREKTPLGERADITIVTPGGQYADRVQELHIKIIHIFIELIERQLALENS